jgi:methylglutaconyl-CoA hydratase
VTIVLNRPEVRNAFNEKMLHELIEVFGNIRQDEAIRAVILTGTNEAFCAGADLNWMSDVMQYTFEENVEDSLIMSEMLQAIYECPCPVIAKVNGAVVGGGTGLVAACDISIGSSDITFALRETRLGLIPAVIYPYLQNRIENRYLKELFLTGERFNAEKAREIGLLNRVREPEEIDEEVEQVIRQLLSGAPNALREAKKLVSMDYQCWKGEKQIVLAEWIARMRMSEEGQEGMRAFLEKRKPNWVINNG